MPGASEATREANLSYREVLRSNPRVAGLLLGDLPANVGTGTLLVAMPVQALSSMTGVPGRFAVNGLLGLNATFALYIVGPVLGG